MHVPEQWRAYQSKVKELHPGWEYRHWTDEDNLRLVETSAPHLLSFYEALPKVIMKVDMIRYVILDVMGGLYLDFDYEFLKPFDLLDRKIVLPRESDDEQELYLGNSVMASEPGHPFWKWVLTLLQEGVTTLGRAPLEEEVVSLTGPGLVTRTFNSNRASMPDVWVPRRHEFNAPYPKNEAEHASLIAAGESYGIHHCHGTWRAKSLPQRALRKLELIKSRLKR